MVRKQPTFETVREIAVTLPGTVAGTSWGAPDFKVRRKLYACRAINKSAEPDTLWVVIGFDQRDELLAADPATYYITDHYVDYPGVLVRLSRVHPDALRDLLLMAWQFVSSGNARGRRRREGAARRTPSR